MKRKTIGQLADAALLELKNQNFANITITHYRQKFAKIVGCSTAIGDIFLSDGFAKKYLLSVYGWDMDSTVKPSAHVTGALRAVRILMHFEKNGQIPGRPSQEKTPPACYAFHFNVYIAECAERGLSGTTISNRSGDICNLLVYARNRQITKISEMDGNFIDEYLHLCSDKTPGAMPRILSSLRCFLRSMFSNAYTSNDLSLFIPSASRYPTKPVSKLWTQDEVKSLMGCIGRSDSKGKRDYAIMLLIVKYGMRVGDILNLKLSDIEWESMTIRFRQEKTSVINALPILDDVGWALADWITNARPKQASTTHVFIRLTAPYGGMKSLDDVLAKRMAAAGISKLVGIKSGAHSLRHALASNMLGQVPLPVITAVLGHSSSSSTTVYLHSDIEGLRQCALDMGGM